MRSLKGMICFSAKSKFCHLIQEPRMPIRGFRSNGRISIGATMVTANIADFADIPELVVEDWTR